MLVTRPQETEILAKSAALWIKYMIHVTIIDSHQVMFYRTVGLEILSHKIISNGAFYRPGKIARPMPIGCALVYKTSHFSKYYNEHWPILIKFTSLMAAKLPYLFMNWETFN